MKVYYNENDKQIAKWLREIINEDILPDGDIDTRNIEDVKPIELIGYDRCHFFAGIGGWEYALQLAGWPEDLPVWTGSCPCQPFSTAGRRTGVDDERHLWPMWRWLIDQVRPPTIFGEQVASKDGRKWYAGVRFDLDRMGYQVGASDLPATSTGAPHIRQRLWWVADNSWARQLRKKKLENSKEHSRIKQRHNFTNNLSIRGESRMADSKSTRTWQNKRRIWQECRNDSTNNRIERSSDGIWVANTYINSDFKERSKQKNEIPQINRQKHFSSREFTRTNRYSTFWSNSTWYYCQDGKTRRIPTESEILPLANGISNRVLLLRGAGNSIVPQVAAEFIKAFMEVKELGGGRIE